MAKYLLDTDISIYTIKRKPHELRRRFNIHEGEMAISTDTLGELLFGAENSQHPKDNLTQVWGFVGRLTVLDYG